MTCGATFVIGPLTKAGLSHAREIANKPSVGSRSPIRLIQANTKGSSIVKWTRPVSIGFCPDCASKTEKAESVATNGRPRPMLQGLFVQFMLLLRGMSFNLKSIRHLSDAWQRRLFAFSSPGQIYFP